MPEEKEFNPIETARQIENSYREYIATTIHFSDPGLQSQLEIILRKDGFLTKGPFLESAPPYAPSQSVADLIASGVLCESMLTLGNGERERFDPERPLYAHQVKAIRKAVAGRNYAVVTGTGSGKTECFLLPILNDIFSEFETDGPSAGVRAMVLYPMNALANDQLKRLRSLLAGTDITFGRYTGDTEEKESKAVLKWAEENPHERRLPNEIISREEIRKNPPNILLTNYSMLEHLLLRPKDAPLFGKAFGTKWRHIAIDEAHVYSGTLGTEIAYLLRRLKSRIEFETGTKPHLHCYATSATIGTEDDMPKVASFASDLFGEHFSPNAGDLDVITSERCLPQDALDQRPWGRLPLSAWLDLQSALAERGEADGQAIMEVISAAGVSPSVLARFDKSSPLLGLGRILLGEESAGQLIRQCSKLLDLTNIATIEKLGIQGLSADSKGVRILTAMVEVLSTAQRSKDVPILSSRYHSFLRAPEGIYINLAEKKLVPNKTVAIIREDKNPTPVYEAAVCRHCGQAYILGREDSKGSTPWLNPQHAGTNADDEFIPNKYYRILDSESDKDLNEEIQWLCPVCGSLHASQEDGGHLFPHETTQRLPVALDESKEKQADETMARCRHCGYSSPVAIQPMRVSPEAAGSVVCYDLARCVPPFENQKDTEENDWFADADDQVRHAGSIICFSDKRQDAAFFAPAMERTYNSITRRQIIREAIESLDDGDGCSISKATRKIVSICESKYPGLLGDDREDLARAWILDELSAEDSRNSLEGLGVIRIEPTSFLKGIAGPKAQKVISTRCISKLQQNGISWISPADFSLFCQVILELLRLRNATSVKEGVSLLRNNHEKRGNWIVLGGENQTDSKSSIPLSGSGTSTTENAFSSFIRRYEENNNGFMPSRKEAEQILQNIFEFLGQYLEHLKLRDGSMQRFALKEETWTLYKQRSTDTMHRCPICGCESHIDTNGVCLTYKCSGRPIPMPIAELEDKDRFYKKAYKEEALPLRIEEHTAQLSSKKAREIQSEFINGDVNVLSCTTTFELGVDVGDLRSIFMRNVPPTVANYTQRAGRVGRRAGKPGYAVTFARLRPHDINFFNDPTKIISGSSRVPICYMDNSAIALRHVFAIALSDYFRNGGADSRVDCSHCYNDFLDLASENPEGMEKLRAYLAKHPTGINAQVNNTLPPVSQCPSLEEIGDWKWVELLVSGDPDNEGRLVRTHELKHADFQMIQDGVNRNRGFDDAKASNLLRTSNALKKELTIAVLAENGILPKYGFPTDLVELHLPDQDNAAEDSRLSLTRGMRQAIREYAPGSEIVAGKTLWKSVGIRKLKGRELEERRFGICPECKNFVWPIETFEEETECPVCHAEFPLKNKVLIPSCGFVAKKENKGIGIRRPRGTGRSEVYFRGWKTPPSSLSTRFAGGTVNQKYAGNGHLCILNRPFNGFKVCSRCNAAAISGDGIKHWPWCKDMPGDPFIKSYSALGASFVSDVLELSIRPDFPPALDNNAWESVMWALFTAASNILEAPETELGGTMRPSEAGGMSIMIYDDVPGGAGHAKRLFEEVERLFEEAYRTVDGHCGCGDETCCYGCIANYYNQAKQSGLSRGAAKALLGELLGK